jgi:type IV pilus assembly protein PilN
MYNLDINFLRSRGLEQSLEISDSFAKKKEPTIADKIPIAAGILVAIVAPAITFAHLQSVKAKTVSVEAEIKQIESEIADLGNQNKKIEAANEEIKKAEQETSALVGVFEKIKPWAAIMQEVSDRTPPGVQVDSIKQITSTTETPVDSTKQSASATEKKEEAKTDKSGESETEQQTVSTTTTTGIELTGTALSYADVNDFVLFLQRSPFFERRNIKLTTATTTDVPVEIENLPEKATLEIPQGIKYTISAQLSNIPTSQLIAEIDKKGSTGLVTRLKMLEQKGAKLQ